MTGIRSPGYVGKTQAKVQKNPKISRRKKTDIADGGGMRHDDGKNRLELLPVEWVWALGDVMTKGADKYEARNWERGMSWGKMIGCATRHMFKFMLGERYDPETGCHHLAMAAWNILGLMSYDLRDIGENDFAPQDMSILEKINSGKGTG